MAYGEEIRIVYKKSEIGPYHDATTKCQKGRLCCELLIHFSRGSQVP